MVLALGNDVAVFVLGKTWCIGARDNDFWRSSRLGGRGLHLVFLEKRGLLH